MEAVEFELKSALLEFDSEEVKRILLRLSDDKNELVPELIEKVLACIGVEWEKGELALSQVYMSGVICERIVDEIFSNVNTDIPSDARIAIVTFNDFHALGKKIVTSVLRSVGFRIIDLGHGITNENLIDKIEKEKIDILLISVLMLPSALKIKNLTEELAKRNIHVKILVGGAPFIFDDQLWKQVGADAMGKAPSDAIGVLRDWLTNKN